MTVAGSVVTTPCAWRSVLPAGRTFLALPSRRHPVVVAERDPQVLSYVRHALLAAPPGSRIPAWAFSAARQMLRVPVTWRLVPVLRADGDAPRNAAEHGLADWLRASGNRVVVLDHSHDPDGRFVLMLFPTGSAEPSAVMKVATSQDAIGRVEAESARLASLGLDRLGAFSDTVPREQDRPAGTTAPVLITGAARGVPMLVAYHRRGHTRRPESVRQDFAAAGEWLAQVQSRTAAARAPLGLPAGTIDAARRQLADTPAIAAQLVGALGELDHRLRRHEAVQTLVHGDFWAGNVLFRDGAVSGVVDWERAEFAGSPVRDLARFAVAYSTYLDGHTRRGRAVPGHRGLVAGAPGGGVRYALDGDGWYPDLVRGFVADGLSRLGLPVALARDVMLSELASIAAEATDPDFRRAQWSLFAQVCGATR